MWLVCGISQIHSLAVQEKHWIKISASGGKIKLKCNFVNEPLICKLYLQVNQAVTDWVETSNSL